MFRTYYGATVRTAFAFVCAIGVTAAAFSTAAVAARKADNAVAARKAAAKVCCRLLHVRTKKPVTRFTTRLRCKRRGGKIVSKRRCKPATRAVIPGSRKLRSRPGRPRGPGSIKSRSGGGVVAAQKQCCSSSGCINVPSNTTSCGHFSTARTCDDDGQNCKNHGTPEFPDD